MRELGEVELSSTMLALLQVTTPLLTVLDWPDAKRGHQKVVEKMSKSCQNLIENFVGWPRLDTLDCKGTGSLQERVT